MFLSNNQLNGTIPTQVGAMHNLQYLTLNNNKLTGTIPSEVGFLSVLQSFELQRNSLTGSVEGFCAVSPVLSEIVVDCEAVKTGTCSNTYCGTPPKKPLTPLEYFVQNAIKNGATITNLDENVFKFTTLTGPIPTDIGQLTQ